MPRTLLKVQGWTVECTTRSGKVIPAGFLAEQACSYRGELVGPWAVFATRQMALLASARKRGDAHQIGAKDRYRVMPVTVTLTERQRKG